MKTGVRITGLQTIEANLNRELQGIKIRSAKGLVEVAIRVRRDTETVNPVTPRSKGGGDLIGSWRTNPFWRGGSYWMKMGYTANYAAYVHAFKDSATNWTRKGSGGQWFEIALKRLRLVIPAIIQRYAKVW